MVGGELRLIPARVTHQGRCLDTCAVDQGVQRLAGGEELPGEGIDRGGIQQVRRLSLDTIASFERGHGLAVTARRDDDLGAGGAQGPRGLQADAGIAAGDNRYSAGQVDARDAVFGRKRRRKQSRWAFAE
jgi:hypothetical protein